METTERILTATRIACTVLLVFLLTGFLPAAAATSVGGGIVANAVWSRAGSPYTVTSDVTVDAGATLTVEAGTTVRFTAGTRLIVADGALRAAGTAATPIIFTSWRDNGIDLPEKGDWGGLRFLDGTVDATTIIEHVTVRYGSTTSLTGASPTFSGCRFENNSGPAISIDLASFPHGSGNSAMLNGADHIAVPAGEMTASGAWDLTGIPYHLEGVISIGAAPKATGIAPAEVELGSITTVTVTGTRLSGARRVTAAGITGTIEPGGSDTSVATKLTVPADVPLGPLTLTLAVAAGNVTTDITVVPPTPVITSVTPGSIYINRPETTVDIGGKNFDITSVAFLDGSALATTYVSSTALKARVPTQALQAARLIQVKNADPRNPTATIASNTAAFAVQLPPFAFSPNSLALRQEEAGRTLRLTIPFAAPAGGVTATLTSTNTAVATVPATVTIPEGATSVDVPLTAPKTANTKDVALEVHANAGNWIGGKATVTVRPQPTINLSPLSLLTGQTFTVNVTATLTDPAPAGGLTITLAAAPANMLQLPTTITVPAGATTAQAQVKALAVGTATITASASGTGFQTGDTCTIQIKPIQTLNYGPMMSPMVGVTVTQQGAEGTADVSYRPRVSSEVGIAVGSIFTAVDPAHAAVGTTNLPVTIRGYGLGEVTDVSFQPTDGFTVRAGTLSVAPDGTAVTVNVDIAADAPVGERQVVLTASGGAIRSATAYAGIFRVTNRLPEVLSVMPLSGITGTTMTFQVNGRHLTGASAIAFEPAAGIGVGNPPVVNADGTLATLSITLDAAAETTPRVVMITTPAGTSSAIPAAGNTFHVKPPATTSTKYPQYGPVVSSGIGVMVSPVAGSDTADVRYTPMKTADVGVAVGAVITGVTPATAPVGTTGNRIRVAGRGLSEATGIAVVPATGITIVQDSFKVIADNEIEVTVDIAADAPTTMRAVVVSVPGGSAAPVAPGADRITITLPEPAIFGMQPIRSRAGQTVSLNLFGKNFTGATAVALVPGTGITVTNPPSVNADGTMATVTFSIAANADVGDRVVTITTPGWTTTTVPSPANTFRITADAGMTYSPLTSIPVGVRVVEVAASTETKPTYGPRVSPEVGVLVTSDPPAGTVAVPYTPVTSRQVGVATGGIVTAMSPSVVRPGSTATVTVSGAGLDQATAVEVAPAAGMTVVSWTPSADGTSGALVLSAGAGAGSGARTLVFRTAGGSLGASTPEAARLLVGSAPVVNSVSPLLPFVGTTFTLTINGANLQGASKVEVLPAADITIDAVPVWNSDGTGEHLKVTLMVGPDASLGERVVVVTTPYGTSDTAASPANTITVSKPQAQVPIADQPSRAAAATGAVRQGAPLPRQAMYPYLGKVAVASPAWKLQPVEKAEDSIPSPIRQPAVAPAPEREREGTQSCYLFAGYRGPPLAAQCMTHT